MSAQLRGVPVSPRPVADIIAGASGSLIQRLESKIVACSVDGCWSWCGATAQKRDVARPKVRIGGRGSRIVTVARVVLAIRDGVSLWRRSRLEAGHTCGNYWCVNPLHLQWETRLENEREKLQSTRHQARRRDASLADGASVMSSQGAVDASAGARP